MATAVAANVQAPLDPSEHSGLRELADVPREAAQSEPVPVAQPQRSEPHRIAEPAPANPPVEARELPEYSGARVIPQAPVILQPPPERDPALPLRAPGRIARALAARARIWITLLTVVGSLAAWQAFAGATRGATLEHSLARYLARSKIEVDQERVVWLSRGPNLLGIRPALFVGRSAQGGHELHDIYYADVRVSETSVVDVHLLTNFTRTSSADEDLLVGAGSYAVYAARVGSAYDALVVLDARGESDRLTRGWPWYAKLQNAVSNLQDTGRVEAFGVRRYNFVQPADQLKLQVRKRRVYVHADQREFVLDPERALPLVGADALEVEDVEKGQPGLITWVVDTVRRVPWIGRGPVEWLEHTVFGITDRANRAYHEVVRTDTAAEVKQALAVQELPAAPAPQPPRVEEQINWPPPPLTPLLPDVVQGEGVWLSVQDDPFVGANPNAPPLFQQTFIRVDPVRNFTRVYVTMWDPRQVQLGIVMGTKEPESATGETGTGMIPRDPYVLSHLVGGFNGGFQATHGEFGMMAEGRVYLPPKPFAATVAVFGDGRVGLGSWPGPGRHAWDESFANSQIPQGMVAMRQNLTSVVEDEAWNPWGRWWWGAAPTWAEEQTFIPRSGLCVTREGYLAYFWGESMGPEELGKAMLAARCVRGMHLDMNGKHTGLEFYRPFAQAPQPLDRALRPSEFEGAGFETGGVRFRSRLAVTTMSPMRFPRYLGQDPRDYFYLTRKPILPGAELEFRGSRIAFSTDDLPTAGFPHPFARARLPGNGFVVRIDPSRAVPRPLADASSTRPLAYLAASSGGGPAPSDTQVLYAQYVHGRLRVALGRPPSAAKALYSGPRLMPGTQATAALGVDAEGFLVYAEAASPSELMLALQGATVVEAIALSPSALVFAGEQGLRRSDGQPAGPVDEATSLAFMAETRPNAEVLFSDVEPLPYRKWGWLQDQRVRYFPSGRPSRFQAPDWVK
ncbi:MAG TPA: hypothetical protein VJV78_46860 [Polyangiales bacterium]|nr:hypothetical protein [Polyangiales bacterium]